jgi:predicted nucleotidyltransferase
MNQLLIKNIEKLKSLCREYKVKRMFVFGSVNTSSFSPKSDIDFLIAFEDNLDFAEYTDNYFALQYALRDMFGREIDLITERSLNNPYFIQSVEQSKQLIYDAAA